MSNIVNRYEDILNDKALWKVCESVHLNMDTVFFHPSKTKNGCVRGLTENTALTRCRQ